MLVVPRLGTPFVVDLKTGKSQQLFGSGESICSASISFDGTRILMVSKAGGWVSWWNTKNSFAEGRVDFLDDEAKPCYAAFDPQGKKLLLCLRIGLFRSLIKHLRTYVIHLEK